MQFIYQPLTWAFLLVLVPLLIHLINLMRQKRVQWAAMEFLLKSNQKHRRWVWLKQFLLLLLRMLVVAAVVAMLAGLISNDDAAFLGGQATHHFIVLDDSISMSDRGSDGSAFDSASRALSRIAEQLAAQPTDQKVTLLRFSPTTREQSEGESLADLNAVTVDSGFAETMEAAKRSFDVSSLAVGPVSVLEMLDGLVGNAAEKSRVVYLLSDFRAREWDQSSELKEALRALRKHDAELHLIRCVPAVHQNLAVVDVQTEAGTLAAGVPLLVNVKVRNFGPSAAQQIAVRLSSRSYPDDVVITDPEGVADEQVTSLLIDEIPAGEVVTRQAQFRFDRVGQHVVSASLPSDSLQDDNTRRCLVDIPAAVPVLMVDGSGQGEEAYYLQSIFAPGRVVTGISPLLAPPTFLRDATDNELERFAAIYLLNVERLEPRALSALGRYVRRGGGLGIFLGPNSDPGFLVDMYGEGEGLFPLPVQSERDHLRSPGDDGPDLQINDHPIFRVLVDEGGKNRPLTRRIRIDRFFAADPDWTPESTPDARVLATLKNEDPLVVGRRFGDGQVIAFLTTASPTWNNWAMGPSFPVVVLQLHGYLSSSRQLAFGTETGEPITVQLDTSEFRPELEFVVPRPAVGPESVAAGQAKIAIEPLPAPSDATLSTFVLGGEQAARTGETDEIGVYVANLISLDGQAKQRRFVVDPPVSESDLALLGSQELSEQLDGLDVEIHSSDELEYESTTQDGFSWSQLLAGLLIAMLVGEQLLAYSASYHPKGGVVQS